MKQRLIKRHNLGGIAETVDSELDKLGTWGKLGVQVIDPTGITGWKDFGDSFKEFQSKGTFGAAASLGLATLGIIPMVGGFGRAKKIAKAADEISDASKVAIKAEKLFDRETYNLIRNPLEPPAQWMDRNFTPKMKKEAIRILEKEITGIIDWCKSKNIKKLPKKLEQNIDNFIQKINMFLGEYINNSGRIINSINWELKGATRI